MQVHSTLCDDSRFTKVSYTIFLNRKNYKNGTERYQKKIKNQIQIKLAHMLKAGMENCSLFKCFVAHIW